MKVSVPAHTRNGKKVAGYSYDKNNKKIARASSELKSGLEALLKGKKPRAPKKLNLKRELNKLTRTAKRKSAKKK